MESKRGIVDIHCHLVPGVDDGARDVAYARRMLVMAYKNGTRAMIVTPHYHGGRYKNTREKTLEQFHKLVDVAKEATPNMRLYLGNELYCEHDIVDRLDEKKAFTLAGTDYVLVEFSVGVNFWQMKQSLQSILQGGYKPIVAHIERYSCMYEDHKRVDELVDMGIYLQANGISITGEGGWRVKRFLDGLLKRNMIHVVASDAHSLDRRNPALKKTYLHLTKKYGKDVANDLLILNPERILRNEYL